MKLNIAILLIIGFATYFITLYVSDNTFAPQKILHQVPNEEGVYKEIKNAQKSPDFSFTTIDGKAHMLNDFNGKTVILNFWASWCAPCIVEFPYFLNIARDNPDGIIFIGLSSDLEAAAIPRFIDKMSREHDMDFSAQNVLLAHDANQAITAKLFQTFKLPETYIIDKQGFIRHKLVGANWKQEDLQAILDGL